MKNLIQLAVMGALIFAGPSHVVAQADAGRALAEQFAGTIDANSDGVIADEELLSFSEVAYASMDVDSNGELTVDEMLTWEFGMSDMAEFRDRTQAYQTAVRIAFDIFDQNNDSFITLDEHRRGVMASANYADIDENGELTRLEYLEGFIFNVAMRNAMVE